MKILRSIVPSSPLATLVVQRDQAYDKAYAEIEAQTVSPETARRLAEAPPEPSMSDLGHYVQKTGLFDTVHAQHDEIDLTREN